MERSLVTTLKDTYSFLNNTDNKYLIDWKAAPAIKEFTFKEGSNINLLEIDTPHSDVTYILEKNVTLHLLISSLEDALSSCRKFVLSENSNIVVAVADFSSGEKVEKFDFDIAKPGATVHFHLATLSAENDKKEFSVSFKHNAMHTYAEMNNYGVCVENSRLVFSGVGHVIKGAKQTKTHQNAKIMVFDPHCYALANPVLKIDENEIEASHAAAVGKVNEEHLFYLTSRGLKEEEAKQLITLGYLKPILPYFDEEVSNKISETMERRMK